jgi:hypothetical protein
MGQTESTAKECYVEYARNVFGGEEDIFTNNENYKMIINDDIKYIDVINKRFYNKVIKLSENCDYYFRELDSFKVYDSLILKKWDSWKFPVASNKCKITKELVINKKLTCKYTNDIKFIINKLEEKIDIDFDFLCFCLTNLLNVSNHRILYLDIDLHKLKDCINFYFTHKFEYIDELKRKECLDKYLNLIESQRKRNVYYESVYETRSHYYNTHDYCPIAEGDRNNNYNYLDEDDDSNDENDRNNNYNFFDEDDY